MSRSRKKRVRKKSQPLSRVLLDIVICVYGKFDLLTRCLDSIPEAAGDIPYRIILVDNDSPDRDEFYSNLETKVALFKNDENKGFILGCNQGASRGKSPLLFMLNSDVILDPGSIEKMVRALDIPEIGVVGMKLRFPELTEHLHDVKDAGKIQHVGLATSIKGDFYHLFIGWDVDAPKVNAVREVLAVTGAALMTRRNLWKKIGGFNPIYGIGCLVGDTYIFSERGLLQLQDVVPDEQISLGNILLATREGAEKSTLFVNNGVYPTIKATLVKGYEVQGTPNHRVLYMKENGTYDWKELSELKIGDYVGVQFGSNLWGDRYINSDDAYLLGLYTSDGCHEVSGRGRITITSIDKEIKEFLKNKGFKCWDDKHCRKTGEIIEKFVGWGIDFSQKSKTKEIPKDVLFGIKYTVVNYLQGLFDGDGCAKNNGWVTYSSSSPILIKQVQMMLLNLGITSGIYEKWNKGEFEGYTLELGTDSRLFYDYVGFRLSRKQRRKSLLKPSLSDSIPYQREQFECVYKETKLESGDYSLLTGHVGNPSHGVRRDTINKLLFAFSDRNHNDAYKLLQKLVSLNVVWLKVKSLEDGGERATYDLHVPGSNSYVAGGVVVHNTYEDVEFCLNVQTMEKKVVVEVEATGIHFTNATAKEYNIGYPLQQNNMLLKSRWASSYPWTSWWHH